MEEQEEQEEEEEEQDEEEAMEEEWRRGAPICKLCFFHLPTLPTLLSQRRSDSEGGEGRSLLVRGSRRHRSRQDPPAPHLVPGPIGPLAGHVAIAYHKAVGAATQVNTCARARRTYAWSLLHGVLGAPHKHKGGHRAGLEISRHRGHDKWRDGSDEETLRVED